MATDAIPTNGADCKLCGRQVAFIYSTTDQNVEIWYCPICFSFWGTAGDREKAEELLESVTRAAQ